MKQEYRNTISEFKRRGFFVIKRYKKAFVIQNSQRQLAIGVLDKEDSERVWLVPLVDAFRSVQGVYAVNREMIKGDIDIENEYIDLMNSLREVNSVQ